MFFSLEEVSVRMVVTVSVLKQKCGTMLELYRMSDVWRLFR